MSATRSAALERPLERPTINPIPHPMRNKSFVTCLLNRFALFSAIFTALSVSNVAAQSRPFVNISTRAEVLNGQNVIVAGFIIQATASTTKQVLIRGMGPSYGLSLADPTITLNGPNGVIKVNNNWKDTQQSEIAATGFQPGNDLESAILWTLPAGSYTVTLGGNNGATGIGLVELYDMGGPAPIVNLSSRARVGTGNNVMIAGVYVQDSTRAVVRAIGPTLANYGIQGALANPMLELYNAQGSLMASNDDWGTDGAAAEIQRLGLQPANGSESAILPTLNPGPYTVIVRGFNNTTGIGMAELYALEDAKYPRIFVAWANAAAIPGEDATTTLARHDLVWMGPEYFGWWWTNPVDHSFWDYRSENLEFFPGTAAHPFPTLRSLNPNIKVLAVLQHYSLYDTELPIDHAWWLRNGQGNRVASPFGGGQYLLNQTRSDLKTHITNRAIKIMQSGQFDGLFLDHYWPLQDTVYGGYTQNDLQTIIDNIRAVLPNALIVVNANENILPASIINKVNGVFMESNQMTSTSQWTAVKNALIYNEASSHGGLPSQQPRVNCLETTGPRNDPRMRATTCLSMIFSNGYALFSDVGNHEHSWYPFWSNHSLGRATSNSYSMGNAFARDFQNGTAVWNPLGSQVTITFSQLRTRQSDGTRALQFTLPANNGDIYTY